MTKIVVTYPAYNVSSLDTILGCLDDVHLIQVRSIKQFEKIRYFDALVLLGGVDVNPQFYGESNKYAQQSDTGRDAVEWCMIRRALAENIPTLGICRGMQMLAIAAGGSLWQDLQRQKVSSQNHQYGNHWLTAVKWPIRQHLPTMKVNSRHHQGVRTLPYGMKLVAKSPDGVPEAIWRPGLLGVQWHPEDMFFDNHRWLGLFRWAVEGLQ